MAFTKYYFFYALYILLFSTHIFSLEFSFDRNEVQVSQNFALKLTFDRDDHAYKALFYEKILKQIKEQGLELVSFEDKKDHYLFSINPIFPALYIFYFEYPDGEKMSVFSPPLYVLKNDQYSSSLSEGNYLSHLSLDEKKVEPVNKSVVQKYVPPSSDKIKELSKKKEDFKKKLISILILLAVACLIYITVRFRRSKSISSSSFIDQLSGKIEHLKEGLLKDDISPKDFYVELTDLLRAFLEYELGIKALEMTTAEFLTHSLNYSSFKQPSQDVLKEILYKADMVKFAQGTINRQDGMLLLEKVKDFIHEHHTVREE